MKPNLEISIVTDNFLSSRAPIWRPISSRQLAKLLGASFRSLANWRVRDSGPETERPTRGKRNRTFYRPDKVLAWMSDGGTEPWEFCREWLLNRGLDVAGALDQNSTAWMIEGLADQL